MYGFFWAETFPCKLWIMFVCVVWLLTREILCSNLALVISFFEGVLCGFSLVSLAKCQNCISNWAITASFHILGVSADHKEKGSDTFPGTSVCFWHVYVLLPVYFVWPWSPYQVRDITPGPLTITDTCIMYHLTNFDASRNVILRMCYVSTCVGARVVGGGR
jgi:hypothetical protein